MPHEHMWQISVNTGLEVHLATQVDTNVAAWDYTWYLQDFIAQILKVV